MVAPKSMQKIIIVKSTYAEIIEDFGVPKDTLSQTLNILYQTLKFSSLKHLWGII